MKAEPYYKREFWRKISRIFGHGKDEQCKIRVTI
jgi:hypothetical protein